MPTLHGVFALLSPMTKLFPPRSINARVIFASLIILPLHPPRILWRLRPNQATCRAALKIRYEKNDKFLISPLICTDFHEGRRRISIANHHEQI